MDRSCREPGTRDQEKGTCLVSVSILILTQDEEINIGACLDSVAWCDDVVVLDSGSEDKTIDIARERGARILQRTFDDFATQRNYGIEHGEFIHDWIFHLDADERITDALRTEMAECLPETVKDAFFVASKLMFQNKWLKHAGMYPVYQVRLGKRGALRFKQVGHGQRETLPPERLGTLNTPLIHEAFVKGLGPWRKRHERYALEEAKEAICDLQDGSFLWSGLLSRDPVARRRAAKQLSWRLPARPLLRFVYTYVFRGGILDGAPGWHYCRLLEEYERMTDHSIRRLRNDSGTE